MKDAPAIRALVPNAPFENLLDPDAALERLLAAARPIRESERVQLADAAGRSVAGVVRASANVPDFPRSAMDGFAVRAADTAGAPIALSLLDGASHAGRTRELPRVTAGKCLPIATGGVVPRGADAVVPVEVTEPALQDGFVTVREAVRKGQHVRGRGHDVKKGAIVMRSGDFVTPERVGLLASLGLIEVEAWRRPRVAVMSTGDELVAPGRELALGQIHDSNSFALAAAVRAWGADVTRRPPVKDSEAALVRAFEKSADADVVVLSGGSSVGEKDLLVNAVRALGGRVLFHGIKLKPGKPLLAARLPRGPLVIGLPGNPASAVTVAHLFVAPVVRKMLGLPGVVRHEVRVPIAEDAAAPPARVMVLPVRLSEGAAWPTFKDSGAITSLTESVGYVTLGPGEAVRAGDAVVVRQWW